MRRALAGVWLRDKKTQRKPHRVWPRRLQQGRWVLIGHVPNVPRSVCSGRITWQTPLAKGRSFLESLNTDVGWNVNLTLVVLLTVEKAERLSVSLDHSFTRRRSPLLRFDSRLDP